MDITNNCKKININNTYLVLIAIKDKTTITATATIQ